MTTTARLTLLAAAAALLIAGAPRPADAEPFELVVFGTVTDDVRSPERGPPSTVYVVPAGKTLHLRDVDAFGGGLALYRLDEGPRTQVALLIAADGLGAGMSRSFSSSIVFGPGAQVAVQPIVNPLEWVALHGELRPLR